MSLTCPPELGAWLRLLETPGVGRRSALKLLRALGSPEAVFAASLDARAELVGLTLARALSEPCEASERLLLLTQSWLDAAESDVPRSVLALGDANYPRNLLQTDDPPLLLYAQGRLDRLALSALAVVGSRNPTPQGLENARAFGAAMSEAGLTVVSGLALGIDGAAHQGALTGVGKTIAVVATGLDRVYPRRHLSLAHQIAREGLLLSEFPIGTSPLAQNFPQRNRIIAGLSQGTLVIEAAVQSGSLITARLAAESGREVFAIPGSIHSPQARGCHQLIKQGAKLVECAQDVLDELVPQFEVSGAAGRALVPEPNEDPVLFAMAFEPVSVEALAARVDWSISELSAHLLSLELSGSVARLPGHLFQRLAR